MLTHLPLIQKLWDRGVDIGVGVITSVIIAVVGLCFWRVKLWLDLRADERKQRQQHRIAAELEGPRRRTQERERHQRLARQREEFANNASALSKAEDAPGHLSFIREALAELWSKYLEWLRSNDLEHLPRNLLMSSTMTQAGEILRTNISTMEAASEAAETMARMIRETELPPLPEDPAT